MASKNNEIPKHELQALARAFADDIIAFFESEEGQREYEEWLQQRKKRNVITITYDFLICLIKDLSEVIKNIDDNTKNEIFSFLQHCFRFLIFLFKDDDYSHEKESRIIIMRSRKNTKTIKIVSDDPPLLCIQPFFQVYVNEVIIGPNCNNSEKWEPYIQLRLEEMWREIEDKRKLSNQSLYSIKHSKIKYTP